MDNISQERIAELEEKERVLEWLVKKLVSLGGNNGTLLILKDDEDEFSLVEDRWINDPYPIGEGNSAIDSIRNAMKSE